MTRSSVLTLTLGLLFTSSCAKTDKKPAAPPPVPVTAAQVEKKSVPLEVVAVGHVDAFSTVAVRPLIGGTVMEVRFQEGQDVAKGAVLFQIDPRPFQAALAQAQANLERDRARAREADTNLKRYEELVKKDYVTKEQYSQAQAEAEALRATTKADEAMVESARLSLNYGTITAPAAGRTGSLLVHAGNIVKPSDDKPLVVINQVEPVYVTFSVPEAILSEIKRRSGLGRLPVSATPNGAAAPSVGILTFIDNTVDATTGTITLKATFPNKDRALWPGQFANVSLTLDTDANAVVAPTQAVQTGQAGNYVYVIKPDSTVEMRPITVKRTWNQWTLVDKGLAPGEKIVTDGQLRLAPGAKVAIKGEAAPPAAPQEKRS